MRFDLEALEWASEEGMGRPLLVPLDRLQRSHIRKVYLGLVHYTDGVDGAHHRIAAAERHLADFGIATECGFGRRPTHQDVRRLIALHAEVVN